MADSNSASEHLLCALQDEAGRLHRWMLGDAFPLWADAGFHDSGAAWEALDFDGAPIEDDESRVRVQARQLYSFALAHRLGWEPPRSADIVSRLFSVLCSACRRGDGLYGRRISLHRQCLTDDTPDLYDNAFVLLALVKARELLGPQAVDSHIDSLLKAIDSNLERSEKDGYYEYLPPPEERLQNPHMHLFESALAYAETTGSDAAIQRAEQLFGFIRRHFFDETEAIVHEIRQSPVSRDINYFEPGHSMEWVWLLGWRSRLLGVPLPTFANSLYARALRTLDDAGRAAMRVGLTDELVDPTHRLWAQTESLRAHLCMAESGRAQTRDQALAVAANCCREVLENWLYPTVAGGWLDHVDSNKALVATKIPASTGYHIYGAVDELLRVVALGREGK